MDHPVCLNINSLSVILPTVKTLPFWSNSNLVSVSASASRPDTSSKNLSQVLTYTTPLDASATTSRISYPSEFSPQLSASAFDIFCMICAFEYVGFTIPLSTVIEISSPPLSMTAETGIPGVPLKERLPSSTDSCVTKTSFTERNLSPN